MAQIQFVQFLCEKLSVERGRQTQLAHDLQISKSTITAWRNGAKPDFISCLLLSEHFNLDPVTMFKMVGDDTYQAVYRRFFRGNRDDRILKRPRERDLYPRRAHAEIHRQLQTLLDSKTEEAEAVTTMIRAAFAQLEAEEDRSEPASSRTPKADSGSSSEEAGLARRNPQKRRQPR